MARFGVPIARMTLAAAGIAVACAGMVGFAREAAGLFAPSVAALGGAGQIALSSVAQGLEPCLRAVDRIAWGRFGEGERRRTGQVCLDLADRARHLYPALAAAHQLRAESLALLDSPDAAIDSLALADATAPNDAWLLQRRVTLALLLPEPDDPALAPLVDAAIVRLMRTYPTRRWLAELYAGAPQLGGMIARNDAEIEAGDKLSFLNLAQSARLPKDRAP